MEHGRIAAGPPRKAPAARPGAAAPSGLLALQRTAGNRAVGRVLARFAEAGHKLAGDIAWDRDQLELAPGFKISFGDAVALGDWFSSFDQIKRLAAIPGKKLGTRGELHYVLWTRIWGRAESEKMGVLYDKYVKHNRELAYRHLKGKNISHFPFPGAGSTSGVVPTYRKAHQDALWRGFQAGRVQGRIDEAMLADGFACHFLTDAFSADHARVPRAAIKAYWDKKVPGFDKKLIAWLTNKIHHGDWGWKRVAAPVFGGGRIETLTREQLAILMTGFGFGDLVSLIVHDAESTHGVEATVAGKQITLVGDDKLIDRSKNVTPQASKDTLIATRNAVQASIDEVFEAYNAGWFTRDWGTFVMNLKGTDGRFGAERLMPVPIADAQLAPHRRSLTWQHPTVEALLRDPRILPALETWGDARRVDLEDAIKDQEPEARAVIRKVLLEPLGSRDGKRISKLLLEILAYR